MIEVKFRNLDRLVRDLKTFAEKAVPHAVRNSLNRQAIATRKEWGKQVRKEFTLRNKWTERTLMVERVRGTNDPGRMFAVVGSTAPYMATQEFGGTKRGGGKHGAAVPTGYAAGQMGARPRTKLVRGPHKLGRITLAKGAKRGNRRQRNAIAMAQARRRGSKFVFLELERKKGLFRLTGGKRNPQVRMVWDTSRKSLRIPKAPTLQITLKRMQPSLEAIHAGAFKQQLERHKIWGY